MIAIVRRLSQEDKTCGELITGALLGLVPPRVLLTGPSMGEKMMWFSGDATLTRVSCNNCDDVEFICLPVSDLLDPFTPRHQQELIIADVELLSMILSLAAWGPK